MDAIQNIHEKHECNDLQLLSVLQYNQLVTLQQLEKIVVGKVCVQMQIESLRSRFKDLLL